MAHAFITWDAALGRRLCALAAFGSRAPQVQSARLVCVDPPRADRETLTNGDDVRGAIALVVRGGCSFVDKAKRIQDAGAIAMILANNTREEPFAMFTMASDASASITIPCLMMCLYDVRELFKQHPPSAKTGVLTLEIYADTREQELVAECEAKRLVAMQQHAKEGGSGSSDDTAGGWSAVLKRKTTSLIKRWESPVAPAESPREATPTIPPSGHPVSESNDQVPPTDRKPKPPLFAFVQWATSATEYMLFFAPLADFCLVANNAIYEGCRVVCDPLLANEDPIRNAAELVDAIALVQRGACTFPAKLERIQRCGAAAVIVGNDDADDEDVAFVMSVDHIKVDHVTIPAVMVSRRVFRRLLHEDKPHQIRILCLSGEAAAECLVRAGQPISLTEIPTPITIITEGQPDDSEANPIAQLHASCRAGDHGACQRVLDESCHEESARRELVTARDKLQLTALHHACAAELPHAGLEHIVALLLCLGAPPNARDLALHTPLHLACLRGHAACVKRLLAAATDTHELTTARNLGGATPIHYAALAGSTQCLELLLSVNARRVDSEKYCFYGVDETDVDGSTPLHIACASAHVDCVLYLIAANADLSRRDTQGRTPLQIACALVNDPTHSLQALHIVEKLMDAGAPVVVGNQAQLAIDAIESKAVKREFEIAFLRREACQSRDAFQHLVARLETQNETIGMLGRALEGLSEQHEATRRLVVEKEVHLSKQQRQIEQLQLQMKTLLQILHSRGGTESDLVDGMALLTGLTTQPCNNLEPDESEVAQDAALARDLGKKCCRERQFALAQTYFERSLDVFPLPGVARLLEETKTLRREAEKRYRDASSHRVDMADESDVARLRRLIVDLPAQQRTKDALLSETRKLEHLDRSSSEYDATLKWLEWLLALPWDQQACQSLRLEASMFDEIERMDRETRQRAQREAARRIQTAFRERFAVHLMRRSMAGERIQRAYRRYRSRCERQRLAALAVTRTRQRVQAPAIENLAVVDEVVDEAELSEDGRAHSWDFDASSTADPRVVRRLKRKKLRVVRGESFAAPGHLVTLQLLAVDAELSRVSGLTAQQSTGFFVWRRWGESREEARQNALCGPYEDLEIASVRYERLKRVSKRDMVEPEAEAVGGSSAWTWLRASAS